MLTGCQPMHTAFEDMPRRSLTFVTSSPASAAAISASFRRVAAAGVGNIRDHRSTAKDE